MHPKQITCKRVVTMQLFAKVSWKVIGQTLTLTEATANQMQRKAVCRVFCFVFVFKKC